MRERSGPFGAGRGKNLNEPKSSDFSQNSGLRRRDMPKQIVYMLRGAKLKEVLDRDGTEIIPIEGGVIDLDGKRYRSLTGPQHTSGAKGELPVYTVYLEELK